MGFALIDLKCSLFEKDCLLAFISKLLGYAIVAGSTSVKIPQILKILKNRSIRGLKIVSFELDVVGYTIALAYCIHKGLPFSAFGELAFILIQAIIVVAIIYYYSKPLCVRKWIMVSLYCGLAPALLGGQVTPLLFEALYASHHAIFLFAKIPQILENFSVQWVGEHFKITRERCRFIITCFLVLAAAVRVFTSIQEKAPTSVLVGSAIGITTNTAILSQMILYQRRKKTERRKKSP